MPNLSLDAKQWCLHAHKAKPSAIVGLGVAPGGLTPTTIARIPNWLARSSPKYQAQQAARYRLLADAVARASASDPDIAQDDKVQQTQEALIGLIEGKAMGCRNLSYGELGPTLVAWQAAMQAAEIKKATRIRTGGEQAIAQLEKSGAFQGDEADLAQALVGLSQDCASVGLTGPQAPLATFTALATHVAALTRLEADCRAYFSAVQAGKKPTRQQTEAMRTVASLGSIDPQEAKDKFGNTYVPPGTKNPNRLPLTIRQGLAALNSLKMLDHYLTRCAMSMRDLERLAQEPIPTDDALRQARLAEFKGRCNDLRKHVQTCAAQLSRLSQTLARLSSDFKGMPPSQRLILRRYGDHLEVLLRFVAGSSIPGSVAPNPYAAAYQFASLGKDEPEAALKLLSGALRHAQGGDAPPVRADRPQRLVSQDARTTFSLDDVQDEPAAPAIPADDDLAELMDELARRERLDQLIDHLEQLELDKSGKAPPRPTQAALEEHLRVIAGIDHTEVPSPLHMADSAEAQLHARTQPGTDQGPYLKELETLADKVEPGVEPGAAPVVAQGPGLNRQQRVQRDTRQTLQPYLANLANDSLVASPRVGASIQRGGTPEDDALSQLLQDIEASVPTTSEPPVAQGSSFLPPPAEQGPARGSSSLTTDGEVDAFLALLEQNPAAVAPLDLNSAAPKRKAQVWVIPEKPAAVPAPRKSNRISVASRRLTKTLSNTLSKKG